jgi:2-desacetyl-2-hydroxyethyl bacteriochlorophyllide A dehydrogenase
MERLKSEGFFLVKTGSANQAFELKAFDLEGPTIDDVLIETEAFGLNFADVMARKGLYREAPPMPCIIGYEVVGKVVSCGDRVPAELAGKRVVAFCRFGGYAKHIVTKASAVYVIDEIPAEQALALCTQGVTAYYMTCNLAPIRKGDRVLVHAAAGGVGSLLVQLCKLYGAEVIAKVSNDVKAKLVSGMGADHIIDYSDTDYTLQLKNILGDSQLDVSFNAIGGKTFKRDFQFLGSGGRMVLFGGAALTNGKWGFLSQLNFLRQMGVIIPVGLMMSSRNILGVNMLKIADEKPGLLAECLNQVMTLYLSGKLKPHIGNTYRFSELANAHEELGSGNSSGKIAVFW